VTRLRFRTEYPESYRVATELPVEVRKRNLALVARTLSSRSVKVDPGEYVVTARLPAGQELHAEVEAHGTQQTVVLRLDEEEASPRESLALQHFLAEPQPDPAQRRPRSVRIRWLEGNLFTGQVGRRTTQVKYYPDHPPKMVAGRDLPVHAQLLERGQVVVTKAVPAARDHDAYLALTPREGGGLKLDVHLEHPTANLLLHYRTQGQVEQASATADFGLQAKELLRAKRQDPVAAAVGAYALLRFADLKRLHEWTENLRHWFRWLPDGVAIRAEHLARRGRHEEAFRVLMELPHRGVPLFSDGLSFALDRLSLYVEENPPLKVPKTKVSGARELLVRLRALSRTVDFGEPVLTFRGDPLVEARRKSARAPNTRASRMP
jgi:hypothetical protein